MGLYRSDIWPGGMPSVGQTAERSRTVTSDDIVLFTGFAEVIDARVDKPITKLRMRVTRDDGTVVLEGDAVCYTVPIVPPTSHSTA